MKLKSYYYFMVITNITPRDTKVMNLKKNQIVQLILRAEASHFHINR